MSLKSKVLLILLGVFLLFGAVDYGIQRFIIFPSFLSLERDEAQMDLERSVRAIKREIYHLDAFCGDWSAWDETYEFVESPYDDYIEANLVFTTFTDNNINLIYICNREGKVAWGEIYDLETEEPIELVEFPKDSLPQGSPLISHKAGEMPLGELSVAGIFMTEQGPMLIASRPIITSNNEGPIRGALIMGRFLNDEMVEVLNEQTQVAFEVFPIQADSLPETIRDIPDRLTAESPSLIEKKADDQLMLYTTFFGIKGDPALLIRAKVPREITAKGSTAIRYALISISAAGLAVLIVMMLLMQGTVLRPITQLTRHALSISKSGDLSARLYPHRSDEIGTLAREFDRMLEQLAEARKKMLEQSYYSGMAEMASGVLHNVRNSLSPIIGGIELLRSDLRKARIKEIEMTSEELDQGISSSERREDLIKFAILANKTLTPLVKETTTKLDEIAGRASQIEKILDDHQKWAHSERPTEQIQLEEVLNDSIKLLKDDLRERIPVKIDPGVAEVGAMTAHQTSLLQVFLNILTNAAESIQRKGLTRGEVHIRAEVDREDNKDMIHVQISDNGQGIEADTLERIFAQGFSTKKESSSGIGLHWCANIVSAMNGKLYAESEGIGKGATFHLLVPKGR